MAFADYRNPGIVADPALDRRLVVQPLWSAAGLDVVSTHWRREQHPERSAGCPGYAAVEVMRSGSFEKRLGRQRDFADSSRLVFYNPGEAYEIRHPVGSANAGTTLRIASSAWEACVGGRAFRHSSALSPAGFVLAVHRFIARAAAPERADALALDEAALALLQQALALDDGAAPGDGGAAPSAAAMQRARTVQLFLNESYRRPLRLADVAAAAGCSAWHVARQFRQATGGSIHASLTRLRLRQALEELRQGAQDLTRLALELGFSSHSHFSAAFRLEFGLTPRDARATLSARRPARSPPTGALDEPVGARRSHGRRDRQA